jgi:hypothetical protein
MGRKEGSILRTLYTFKELVLFIRIPLARAEGVGPNYQFDGKMPLNPLAGQFKRRIDFFCSL